MLLNRIRDAALGVVLMLSALAAAEAHKARIEVAAARARTDVAIGLVRELSHLAAPKQDHAVCPAHDGHEEVDSGPVVPCVNPDRDGPQCVSIGGAVVTAAAWQARCQAGKL